MKPALKNTLYILMLMAIAGTACAQGMQMGEVIIVTTPTLKKDVKPEALKEVVPTWNKAKPGVNFHLFQADRGKRNGEFLLVCAAKKVANREAIASGSPFTDKVLSSSSSKPSDFLSNPNAYTEYRLIGAKEFKALPDIGILGIHYIKVKKDRAKDFEKFVIEKMHPAVGSLLPDMHLLTYQAVAGDQAGTYITIFAIESVGARDKYWPAGKPETEILKQAFQPHQDLARELSAYLVEGSYLEPSGGAAAIFESREWTDFIHQAVLK